MSPIKAKYISSLAKVFPDKEPRDLKEDIKLSALWGEEISFQLAYYNDLGYHKCVKLRVESPLQEHIRIRKVELVPSRYPCHAVWDEDYLSVTPGMFPDLLTSITDKNLKLIPGQWRSLWIDINITEEILKGIYPIKIDMLDEADICQASIETQIEIIGAKLPQLRLKHTEWFHGDCLADYYNIEVFSDRHWEIMSNFIEIAARRNCNMILVPMFTPPLDTLVGGERTTIQLVEVAVINGSYHFKFDKLKQFITMCQKKGIRYFEMSHLFTQWGANAAPKIMATVDGTYQRIFGWDTPAAGSEYEDFLKQYLPCLTEKLIEWGLQDVVYFHISDEPGRDQLNSYKEAWNIVHPFIKDFHQIDALSDYEFYKEGLVEQPVCATNHVEPFLDNKTENLWTYYCSGQTLKVANRFFVMPSYRNRIYGIQNFIYNIEGILHWGYNFYNSQYSIEHINPYENTDASEAFPSGDSFLVYPGKDGKPEESIRIMVLDEGLNDYRAMQLLELLAGRDRVLEIIKEISTMNITFSEYPRSETFLLKLREEINQNIKLFL